MPYFWPASALTEKEMAALYRAREASKPKIPINELIAMAIRKAYLSEPCNTPVQSTTTERKEAA